MTDRPLTPRQRAFVDHYAGDGQAAAIKAGYSPKGAKVEASRLLRDPRVKALLDARDAADREAVATERRAVIRDRIASRDEVLARLTKIARSKAYEPKDRIKALELLGKSHGAFTDKVDLNAKVTLEDLVTQSLKE